ncbi:MAG TPA: Mrp/NBP35 family ATP-binding protein [Gemmatimonadales bacterium]
MHNSLEAAVTAALARVVNPRVGNDLLSAGMVRDVAVSPEGRVTFTFLLSREDPATLVREARKALQAIEGVSEVKISVVDPAGPARTTHAPPGPPPQSAAAGVPAPVPAEFPNIKQVIAVSSGKGGVGKSTVAVNLAIALAARGYRVGVMDADIYGPDIPRMFGIFERPRVIEGRIQPHVVHDVKLISLGFLVERDAAAIWRGPIIMKVIQQFLRDVAWGELDYLIVDMPPGTGDAQLSLVQSITVNGGIIVTTPQEVAVNDALRGARMFERVNVPVLGIIENMSGFTDPETGRRWDLFGTGGGQRLAEELGVPLLGQIPLQADLTLLADKGQPVLVARPESPAARALAGLADRVVQAVASMPVQLPVLNL